MFTFWRSIALHLNTFSMSTPCLNTRKMSESLRILDGGLGSDLFINGGYDRLTVNSDPLWLARVTYEHPDSIKQAHMRFINAGCDVISTGSYQASVQGYIDHAGVTREKAQAIIASSVDIAKDAITESDCRRNILIAGSISPYGASLHDLSEYTGNYMNTVSYQHLKEFHETNVRILANKGLDLFAFETLPALKEALVLLDILKEFPNCKAWVSFTTKDGSNTSFGEPFTEVFQTLSAFPQVIAVGTNCCDSKCVQTVLEVAKDNIAAAQKCIIYPDNGQCPMDNIKTASLPWLPEVKKWLDTGVVGWIGGCCSTTPHNIGEINQAVQEWKSVQ